MWGIVTRVVKPLRANIFNRNIKISTIYLISQHRHYRDCCTSSSGKSRTDSFYIVYTMGADALAMHKTMKFHLSFFIWVHLGINRCWVIKLLSMDNEEPFHSCINASLCPSVFPNLRSISTIIDRDKEYVHTPDQIHLHPPVKTDCHQTWRTFVSMVFRQDYHKHVSDVHCNIFSAWRKSWVMMPWLLASPGHQNPC